MNSQSSLEEVVADWNELGFRDPFWAVLTDPTKDNGRWEPKEFFQTGDEEVEAVLTWLCNNNIVPNTPAGALDFGCGVGRLTLALSKRFGECTGVDASDSMVGAANRIHAMNANVKFVLNTGSELTGIDSESFDFVYTNIVLQHIPPPYALGYISELLRITKPSGLTIFQVPTGPWNFSENTYQMISNLLSRARKRIAIRSRLLSALRKAPKPQLGKIEMHMIPEFQIGDVIQKQRKHIVARAYSNACELAYNGRLVLSNDRFNSGGFLSQVFVVQGY